MKKIKVPPYVAPLCDHCGQHTHYPITIDRGCAYIMIALYNRVKMKNENAVHLIKDMTVGKDSPFGSYREMITAGCMTPRMVGNMTRCRVHGLVAFAGEGRGSGKYLITRKGADFLRGKPIPKTAIVAKANVDDNHSNVGYWHPEDTVTIEEALKEELFWDVEYLKSVYPEDPTASLPLPTAYPPQASTAGSTEGI